MISSLAIAVSLLMISISYCIYISFNDLTIQLKDKYSIEVFFIDEIEEAHQHFKMWTYQTDSGTSHLYFDNNMLIRIEK